MKLGVLASHRGTNLQAMLDACRTGALPATLAVVISNNSRSGALERARRAQVPAYHLSGNTHPGPGALDAAILETLERYAVELLVLAGYMKKLGPRTLARYRGRVLNTHPALLPKFGGRGMYGERVHAAVLAAGERETGVSVHLVDADYDTGPVVAQTTVPVLEGDTPESLGARVLEREHDFLIETLRRVVEGGIRLPTP